jgi:hypothetical protein
MAVFEAYRSEENKDIETVIVNETSGDLCKAFLSVGKYEKKEKFEDIKGVNRTEENTMARGKGAKRKTMVEKKQYT